MGLLALPFCLIKEALYFMNSRQCFSIISLPVQDYKDKWKGILQKFPFQFIIVFLSPKVEVYVPTINKVLFQLAFGGKDLERFGWNN